MVASIAYVLFVGITGKSTPWILDAALVLVTLECIVFVGNGWRCPLTTVAVSISGREGKDYAPMIPENLGRYTPSLFGALFGLALILLVVRITLLGGFR